jgi:hypothetical protein
MPNDYDPSKVDPSVTAEEIELAHDGTPAAYPDLDEQDTIDDVAPVGLMGPSVATIPERIVNARNLRADRTFVGVGMCLATVRGPILGLPAVYPSAEVAGHHSSPFHPIGDPGDTTVPRGAIGFAFNGGNGHVWLELGGGLVSTTDFHENGYEGVALRSRMLAWCGATSWGWGESVNGFDVWPDPKKPKPPAPPWGLAEREREVHRALHKAKANEAPAHRIAGLQKWDDSMIARVKAAGLKRLAL